MSWRPSTRKLSSNRPLPAKSSQFRSWDEVVIPGTTVLRNKLVPLPTRTTRDAEKLCRYEERAMLLRAIELDRKPIEGNFDYAHLKAIHRALFQDVYEWAGQERVGPDRQMSKSGSAVVHFAPEVPAAPTVQYGITQGPGIRSAKLRKGSSVSLRPMMTCCMAWIESAVFDVASVDVGVGVTGVNAAESVDDAGVEAHLLGEAGFARVYVRLNPDSDHPRR